MFDRPTQVLPLGWSMIEGVEIAHEWYLILDTNEALSVCNILTNEKLVENPTITNVCPTCLAFGRVKPEIVFRGKK